ncbi:MAG: glutamate--tRNA ligase family protein [Sphaerochaetaceae bacterium]|nr:glutamate--tRNA ligase family protein [Sphaerochaetaceae bacterium]
MKEKNTLTFARKYTVKNAFEHEGCAQTGAVIGKVKTLFPEIDLKKVTPKVMKIVSEVNKLNKIELEIEYKKFEKEGWELKHIEKEKCLPEIKGISTGKKIITRIAPCPTGVMHFGHARPAILNSEYIKKYGGKFILRFDDTDPKIKFPEEGIEQEFINDLNWLGVKIDEIIRQSDRLPRYYEIIYDLIKTGKAYVCICPSEEWKNKMIQKTACNCREQPQEKQLNLWKTMLEHKITEGNAVVRLKTDLSNKDPTMRDWWVAKIVDKIKHTNKKVINNHVWPSYNLASAVDDHDMGITFMIRGQEHIPNEIKQRMLYEYYGWTYPITKYHGKISRLGNTVLSKSKMKLIMEKEGILNYDDPRLATIKALKRKGIQPETIREIILNCGLNIKETNISEDLISQINKKYLKKIDDSSFIEKISQITLNDKNKTILYIEEKYIKLNKINLRTIGKLEKKGTMYNKIKTNELLKTIQWINNPKKIQIILQDGSKKEGYTETNLEQEIIRLSEIGYCKKDKKENEYIFMHK